MRHFILLFCLLYSTSLFAQEADSLMIYPDNTELYYQGRIDSSSPLSPLLVWAGTSVTMNFEGDNISVVLDDDLGQNYFAAIIDGIEQFPIIIKCEKGEKQYHIVKGLPKGEHTLLLYKRTEPWEGTTFFKGFVIKENGKVLARSENKKLKIEFYGNSITSGMGNEDISTSGKSNALSSLKNNYLSYSAITARKLNAEFRCISLSGIGVLVSWDEYIMPEVYNRVNLYDSLKINDFNTWVPDVVVINLMQNDSWLVKKPDYKEFKKRFPSGKSPSGDEIQEAYFKFVKTIRSHYPQSYIVCALGSMDATIEGSEWIKYVENSVERMKKQENDSAIELCIFPFEGHYAHPTVFHDCSMADKLTHLIKSAIK